MNNSLYYITYQDFPANTANSQQTIASCKYFVRNNFEVTLFFPLRSRESNDDSKFVLNYYEVYEEQIFLKGLSHKFKFERKKYLKKINYVLQHVYWSYKAVREVINEYALPKIFMTRSEWVFYFLSRKNLNVIFECHKLTKLRTFIVKRSIGNRNSKIIVLNSKIKEDLKIDPKFENKILVQSNGYDEDFFFLSKNKIQKQVIFAGSIYRLGIDRDLEFIIDSFKDSRLSQYTLKIFGGTEEESSNLKKKCTGVKNINVFPKISKKQLSNELANSEIALLTGKNDSFSSNYTSPIKFYEYSISGAKVVAVDFPAHRNLDHYNNMVFYKYNDKESFISAILSASNFNLQFENLNLIMTIDKRVKNIIQFIN